MDIDKAEVSAKPVEFAVLLNIPLLLENTDCGEISEYDGAVYNAICTHAANGNWTMSLSMIRSVMVGRRCTSTASMKKSMYQSIDRMRHMSICLEGERERNLLDCCFAADTKINGKEIEDCIRLGGMPVLLELARKKNCLYLVPKKAHNTPGGQTKRVFAIKNFIFRAIADRSQKNRIPFRSIYEVVIAPGSSVAKTVRARIRECVLSILEHCKEIGWIKDYEIVMAGHRYRGIAFARISKKKNDELFAWWEP